MDQKFCRGCGHARAGHRGALENNFEDVVDKIKSGATALGISAVGLIFISLTTQRYLQRNLPRSRPGRFWDEAHAKLPS